MTIVIDPDVVTPAGPQFRDVPGAFETYLHRQVEGVGLIEFEQAPAGWLTKDGKARQADWRAYHLTPPSSLCGRCDGAGKVAGAREGTTKKCPDCKGTGDLAKRTRLISVTTLLDAILPKGGLPVWAEARGIEGAIEAVRLGLVDPHDPPSAAMAVDVVRERRLGADRARDDAADRGLNVHALLQAYMETGAAPNPAEHPQEHHGYIRALTRWLREVDPEPVAVELLVAHPEDRYAGRLDLIGTAGGQTILWDAKTQEKCGIYPGAHLQARLYERARRRCGDDPVDDLRVVAFAADGEWREMPCGATDEAAERALAYYELLAPINSACESANRIEREARR
jgi:hypothetical protein